MARLGKAELVINAINKTGRAFQEIQNDVGRLDRRFSRLGNMVTRRIVPAFLALKGANIFGRMSDEFTTINNRLNVVSGSAAEAEDAFSGITKVARETQGSLSGTANLYSRLVIATKDLNLSQQQQLVMAQALNQTFRISGATAQETAAASIQLAQGLASGRLAGDELRSVLENNAVLGQLLAKAFNTNVGTLRDFAAEGKITGDIVADVLLRNLDQLNDTAQNIAPTFQRTGQVIQDQFGAGFASATKESFSELNNGLLDSGAMFNKLGEIVGRVVAFTINLITELADTILLPGRMLMQEFPIIGEAITGFFETVENIVPNLKAAFRGLINEVIKFGNLFIAVFKAVGNAFMAFGDTLTNRFEALGKDLVSFVENPLAGVSFDNTRKAMETGFVEAMGNAFDKTLEEARVFNRQLDEAMFESITKITEAPAKKAKGGSIADILKGSGAPIILDEVNTKMGKMNDLQRDAQRVINATKTAQEQYNEELERLNRLLEKGYINQETYGRAEEQAQEKLERASDKTRDKIGDGWDALGKSMEDSLGRAMDGMSGGLDNFKDVFSGFLSDMNQRLLDWAMKDLGITGEGGILSSVVDSIGSIFSGGGGSGGTGGFGGLVSSAASLFSGFFADGGTIRPGHFGVVGERGPELAFAGTQPMQIAPMGGGSPINVSMHITTPGAQGFRQSQGQIAAEMARSIERAKRNL
jgi:tape measure domain-containing protein